MATSFAIRVGIMILFIGLFFALCGILMGAWNYTIPRLITSVGSPSVFVGIDYATSIVFLILLLVMFAPGQLWSLFYAILEDMWDMPSRKRAVAYNVNPVASTNFSSNQPSGLSSSPWRR